MAPVAVSPEFAPGDRLPDDLLTVPQAAVRVGMSADALYQAIRRGGFPPAVRVSSRTIRVSVPRLERFLHGEAS
jgi:predicted DNA-binding transcriptional regulator AlpA